MPIRADRPKLGDTAKAVADHASALAKLEVRLATLELKRKAASMAIGIGLAVGAALLGLVGLLLGVAATVAAIAIVLPVWASILVVLGGAFGLALVLAALAVGALRRGGPPVPEQAIEEARLTTEALRSGNGR